MFNRYIPFDDAPDQPEDDRIISDLESISRQGGAMTLLDAHERLLRRFDTQEQTAVILTPMQQIALAAAASVAVSLLKT